MPGSRFPLTRTYDMTKRSRRAAETSERIAAAAEALLADAPLSDVTLEAIAEGAGVSVQTVLRHMGSRDGCFDAVRERVMARVEARRGASPPGDVAAALADLVEHYEADGRLVLNLLAQEATDAFAREATETGRAYHRAWVERCFARPSSSPDPEMIDALVAASDIYVWKLLRLDLGRSRAETEATLNRLVRAVLESS